MLILNVEINIVLILGKERERKMLRVKVDFIKEVELNEFVEMIEEKYDVVEKSVIKNSKKQDSKFKVQFLDLIRKEENQ